MDSGRPITMEYLADVAGVNAGLVRRYVWLLRSMIGDCDLFSGQEASTGK